MDYSIIQLLLSPSLLYSSPAALLHLPAATEGGCAQKTHTETFRTMSRSLEVAKYKKGEGEKRGNGREMKDGPKNRTAATI